MALGPFLLWICRLSKTHTKIYTAYDRGNSPYGEITTKKEPIRTLGSTSRLPCHIHRKNILHSHVKHEQGRNMLKTENRVLSHPKQQKKAKNQDAVQCSRTFLTNFILLSFALRIPTAHDFHVIRARTWAVARTQHKSIKSSTAKWMLVFS